MSTSTLLKKILPNSKFNTKFLPLETVLHPLSKHLCRTSIICSFYWC